MSYSNPAFAALGIKSFKLPSRNWMIFWTVVGTLGGGIVYDKWKQRQLRDEYMEKYKNQCAQYPLDEIPRKLRIYVAPTPNDYLDESMKYFRRFVKPMINASGLDYELITMERQGDIRYKVAEEIRALRRKKAGLEPKQKEGEKEETDKDLNVPTPVGANINPVFQSYKVDDTKKTSEDGEIKSVRELYEPMDVLGVKRVFGDFHERVEKVKSEDALVSNVRDAGGIICIGRGAFKEYVNGVHEGLLGPLDAPPPPPPSTTEEVSEPTGIKLEDDVKTEEQKEKERLEKEKEKEEDAKYAPAAYIYAKDYRNSTIAPELDLDKVDFSDDVQFSRVLDSLRDEKSGIPYFFVQPVLELRNYNVAGFTRQPERMWRFYHKREQLIEFNEKILELVHKKWCAFTKDDLNDGIEEEGDWPSSWLKVARKNNSEWVREFDGDDRVMKLMASYNCKCEKDDVSGGSGTSDAAASVEETK